MWLKNFRHKKLQSLMVFIIISLCSMLLTASVSILISLDKPYQEFAKECDSATAILYPYSDEDRDSIALGEGMEELDEVKKIEYTRSHYLKEEVTYNNMKIESFLDLTEYNENVFGKVRYLEGDKSLIYTLKEDECIIPACLRNKYDMKLGQKITIKFSGEKISYTIKGVYSDPYDTSTAFNSALLIKKLPSTNFSHLRIRIYGKDGVTGSQIEEAYRLKHDGQIGGMVQTLEDRIDKGLIASNVVGGLFLAIGIIMLLVSCLIIHYMIRNAMITDAKNIAIYKTMGYTSGDVLILHLLFYFLLVSTACILGIISSVWLSNMTIGSVFENMGQVVSSNVLIPGIPCYILTVGFVLLIIYFIINRTRKVKPVYALNGMSQISTGKRKEYKGNNKIQFSAFGIAIRTLGRNKKSAVSIIITSIVTIFTINFAIISLDVAYSLKDNNDYWLGVDKCDVMIGVTSSEEYETVHKVIDSDNRVDYALSNTISSTVMLKWKKGAKTTSMEAFIYDDYSKAKLPIVYGRNPKAANEIAISGKVSKDMNKSIGDYIEIYLEGDKKVNLLVTGIFQTYFELGDCCRLMKSVYTENNCKFQYNNISIYLKDKEKREEFIKDTKAKLGSDGNVIARKEAFSSIMDMIADPQKKAVPPVCLVVLLVAGINIFCIVMLKNASNEKVNGIYKSMGYSTGHLILSNLYYVGMIAVVSEIVAVPLTLLFYPNIMKVCLGMFGFLKYPVTYNILHIVWANIVVLFLFIASTFISSRSLRKVNVRDLVQE